MSASLCTALRFDAFRFKTGGVSTSKIRITRYRWDEPLSSPTLPTTPPELVLNDAVGGEHHIGTLQLLGAGAALGTMVDQHLVYGGGGGGRVTYVQAWHHGGLALDLLTPLVPPER